MPAEIPGYPHYFATEDGEIISHRRNPRTLKPAQLKIGYEKVIVHGQQRYVHHLVWTAFNGSIPEGKYIDHINRDRSDNRLENLRLVTRAQNNRNAAGSKNNISGFKGVTHSKMQAKRGKPSYFVRVMLNRETHFARNRDGSFKWFDCPKEAYSEACRIRNELHGEYAAHVI